MFFAGLFAAYFTIRAGAPRWPPPGVELATGRTALATAVLVSSSATMHGAVKAAGRDHRRQAVRWLALTVLLGLIFLGNQAWEYAEAPFSISSHAYGSLFYVMTGFHGLHVIGGSGSRAPASETVEGCGYYWHFVDVVWVAMFSTLYLLR